MRVSLSSVALKLSRSAEHIKTIEDAVHAWYDSDPYQLSFDRNKERTRIGIRIKSLIEPDLLRWGLLVGDAVHNMRSALDHAVYSVAVRENGGRELDPKVARRLEFPIADDPTLFADRAWRIESLSTTTRTRLEGAQPYNRMRDGCPPVLSVLRDFDDTDKHRLLRIGLAFPSEQEIDEISGLDPGQYIDFRVHVGAITDGTEVASLTFDRPSPNVNLKYSLSLVVGIGHAWGPLGYRRYVLLDMLHEMTREVTAVLAHLGGAALAPPSHAAPLDWPPDGEYEGGEHTGQGPGG